MWAVNTISNSVTLLLKAQFLLFSHTHSTVHKLLSPDRNIHSKSCKHQHLLESMCLQSFHFVSFYLSFSNFSPLAFISCSLLPFAIPPDPSYHFTAPMFITYFIPLSLSLPCGVRVCSSVGIFSLRGIH